uniref:Uncharacterized protein n=1 Tax=viral metagenome TaxID=1070528 RepID=A0A6M3KS39_9ZZZZ
MGRKSKYFKDDGKVKKVPKPAVYKKKDKGEVEGVKADIKAAPIVTGPVSKRTYDLKDYTNEELAKIVADYTRTNPFRLSGLDPRYEYRFINRRDDRMERRVMMGWEIITGPEAEKIASESGMKVRQGQIQLQDGVLAKMPKQIVMAVRRRYQELGSRMIGASSKTLKRDVGEQYSRNVEESLKVRDKGFKEVTVI